MIKFASAVLIWIMVTSCAAGLPRDRGYVSRSLGERGAGVLSDSASGNKFSIPEGVVLTDGITSDEAVASALWNNPQFQADLLDLGYARADLQDASLFTNPVLSFLFPAGPKQMEANLALPLAEIWQRPRRVGAAKLDAARIAENLVQHGLALTRDVRVAFADAVCAAEQARLAREKAKLQAQIAGLARARLDAGDISALEATAEQAAAGAARDEAARLEADAATASIRFHTLIGWSSPDTSYELLDEPVEEIGEPDIKELLRTAYASRPDLRAAELEIEAAAKRLGWERAKIFNLVAIIDGNADDNGSWELGPGLNVDLPLLNLNNGGRTRARTELEQSARLYLTARHRISREVREANAGYSAMREAFNIWSGEIVPAQELAFERSLRARNAGEESSLFVMQARLRLLDALAMESRAARDLRSALADLEYSTGKKL